MLVLNEAVKQRQPGGALFLVSHSARSHIWSRKNIFANSLRTIVIQLASWCGALPLLSSEKYIGKSIKYYSDPGRIMVWCTLSCTHALLPKNICKCSIYYSDPSRITVWCTPSCTHVTLPKNISKSIIYYSDPTRITVWCTPSCTHILPHTLVIQYASHCSALPHALTHLCLTCFNCMYRLCRLSTHGFMYTI